MSKSGRQDLNRGSTAFASDTQPVLLNSSEITVTLINAVL